MRNLAHKIEEFSKCDDFSGEISSAHRYYARNKLLADIAQWRIGVELSGA
jgi:hypothetical protein